jgi:uncharacterized protein YjbJ (UPF0337 family)
MDNDRVKGSAKQVKGKAKEGIGNITGDEKLEREGDADRAQGKTQDVVGSVKDTLREDR